MWWQFVGVVAVAVSVGWFGGLDRAVVCEQWFKSRVERRLLAAYRFVVRLAARLVP